VRPRCRQPGARRQPPQPATAASHRSQPPQPATAASHRNQPPQPATAASHRNQPRSVTPQPTPPYRYLCGGRRRRRGRHRAAAIARRVFGCCRRRCVAGQASVVRPRPWLLSLSFRHRGGYGCRPPRLSDRGSKADGRSNGHVYKVCAAEPTRNRPVLEKCRDVPVRAVMPPEMSEMTPRGGIPSTASPGRRPGYSQDKSVLFVCAVSRATAGTSPLGQLAGRRLRVLVI